MTTERKRQTMSRPLVALLGFLAIVGFFLVTEHRAHLYGYLPYLLVLACPLLHLFGHGGHGGHGTDEDNEPKELSDSRHHHG
ncbi:MAG: DUF2933 domain-containing protein [Candidatus Peribacteraceae bacterium]